MGVQSYGQPNDGKGHEKSYAAFVRSHRENTDALLNLAEGKSEEEARPVYDPNHPDNAWPLMIHHPHKGELAIGKNLKGITDPKVRAEVHQANKEALKAALHSSTGYQREPFIKPQIAVLSPEAEKMALKEENDRLKGQMVMLNDKLERIMAKLEPDVKG